MWPKLLTDLVFLRSKTQSFPWKNIDSNTHMGCGEGRGEEVEVGKVQNPRNPSLNLWLKILWRRLWKRRFKNELSLLLRISRFCLHTFSPAVRDFSSGIIWRCSIEFEIEAWMIFLRVPVLWFHKYDGIAGCWLAARLWIVARGKNY